MNTLLKTCLHCKIQKPETAFWLRGTGGSGRRSTCAECYKTKKNKITDASHPMVEKILRLLRTNGPMTSDELSDFIPDKTPRLIGSDAGKIRKLGLIDRVVSTTANKQVTWFIPGQMNKPLPVKHSRKIEFKSESVDDDTDLKVKRKHYPAGMTEEDYVWMQKYRARAELRKIPRTERARNEYTA